MGFIDPLANRIVWLSGVFKHDTRAEFTFIFEDAADAGRQRFLSESEFMSQFVRSEKHDRTVEHGYRIRNKLSGKFLSGSKETATGKQWSKLGHLKLAIHNVCGLSSYPGGAATDAKNKAKVQAWLDKYEVIEVGGIGNRVMNPGEYLPDAHLAALSS
ncbi:TPA: hypothetical protein NWA32_004086 [Escherichia coli]|nr:hypothetical protein [Escherichia coli]